MNNGFDDLNEPIKAEEITECVKNLKNNKSFADDHIINEYLKSTLKYHAANIRRFVQHNIG